MKLKRSWPLAIGILSLAVLTQLATEPAWAHVLKTEGTIGAVIHISPNDDPIAGESSDFFFDFKDTTGHFTQAACNCTVSITENGQPLYSEALFAHDHGASYTSASFSFTFPKKDVYQVIVRGTPKQANQFQPFTLTYDVRVQRQSTGAVPSTQADAGSVHALHYGAAGVIAIVFVVFLIIDRRRAKPNLKKPLVKCLLLFAIGLSIFSIFENTTHMHASPTHSHECCLATPVALAVPVTFREPPPLSAAPVPHEITYVQVDTFFTSHNKSPPTATFS